MTILNEINERFPVRRSEAQKEAFRKWVIGYAAGLGRRARVEESDKGRHSNVVIGNPDTAKITITAHYDTPCGIGLPNMQIPRNWAVYYLVQLVIILGMLGISLAAAMLLGLLTKSGDVLILGFFFVYMALLMLMIYGPANRHNVNDNTSGVTALLETLARIAPEDREKVAFILFDNQEKGNRGSKAYARDHLQVQHTRLIVNLDCVGVGDQFIVSVPKLARNMDEYELLERILAAQPGRTVHFFSSFTTRGNSDYRSFKCGVGISAHRIVSGVGFYTGDIHTARDTETDEENLLFLAQALSKCVAEVPGEDAE